jgi:hypothetical protein
MRPEAGRGKVAVVMLEWDAGGKVRGFLVFLFPVSQFFGMEKEKD